MTVVELQPGLSADAIERRKASIGGSDANTIMNGDARSLLHLWELKTGRTEPEDLSGVLPVQMGIQTEPLNRAWFERVTGKVVYEGVSERSRHRHHPDYPWMTCTLDGWFENEAAVLECKHVNAWSRMDDVIQRYMPQLHHCMMVTGWRKAYLSVFIGTLSYEWCEVAYDSWYAGELMDREIAFWNAVQNDAPPVHLGEPVTVAMSDMREADMTGSNAWADAAHDWTANKRPAQLFDKAAKSLKAMMEPDVKLATGHGVKCSRSKAGALTIRELKE